MSRAGGLTLRLPCTIVKSPRRHKHVPFVNTASLRSRSTKRRQWKHKLDYYGIDFAHLATGCGINAKDPSGLDSDRWILHSRHCENPAQAKALVGFSRHLSAGFKDPNPAPPGLSLKGLRPVLEDFVVTVHEGACQTGSQILRALARGIWRTVLTSPSALWQQTPTDRSYSWL